MAADSSQGFGAGTEDLPRLPHFVSSAEKDGEGVFRTDDGQFYIQVMAFERMVLYSGFTSMASARSAFHRLQAGLTPLPVAGGPEVARPPKPAEASAPKPAPLLPTPAPKPLSAPVPAPARLAEAAPARRFKGVYSTRNHTFSAKMQLGGKHNKYLGSFPTAEEAADAYDEGVREAGGKMMNTPRYPGEIQAVGGKRGRPRKLNCEDGAAGAAASLAAAAAAAAAVPELNAPDAEPSKRKRGRPRKAIREDGAAEATAPSAAAAAAAAAVAPSELAAAGAAQFCGVTAIPGGNGFHAWLSYHLVDGTLIRQKLGEFVTAELAACAVDAEARRHSLLEQLNFPTPEECARFALHSKQACRQPERKVPESDDDDALGEAKDDDDDDWVPRGTPRRRIQSQGHDAITAPPKAPPAPAPAPSQLPAVTPDPLALLMLAAPPLEAPLPPSLLLPLPNNDVITFLRNISPPLRCLDTAVAAAPDSGVSMRQLRQLSRLRHPTLVAAYVERVAAALHINGAGDRLDLIAALDRLAGPGSPQKVLTVDNT